MIHPERVRKLKDQPLQKGRFVLYWMQASQRVEYNHALEYAIREANEQNLPLVTLFVLTGKMHNYMRMYWGKKILEWSPTPEEAFRTALYLNNKYELDGRDPNSFTGVAWCFGKHDRPWGERKIFGQVRYMNDAGLRRKFKIDDYVRKVEAF